MAKTLGFHPNKEEVEALYIEQRLPISEVAAHYGVHKNTMRYWLKKLGIPRRLPGGQCRRGRSFKGKYPCKHPMPSREELFHQYWEEKVSLRGLAQRYAVSVMTIRNWFVRLGIRMGPAYRTAQPMPNAEELRALYGAGESIAGLARRYNADKPTVRKWLQELGISIRHKGAQEGVVFTAERVRNILKGLAMRPTKPETNLDQFLQEWQPGEWLYNGDGKYLVIAGKAPDFININGRKALIELYGDYWHKGENPEDRIAVFGRYGYPTLIIWEHELQAPDVLREKVLSFKLEASGRSG